MNKNILLIFGIFVFLISPAYAVLINGSVEYWAFDAYFNDSLRLHPISATNSNLSFYVQGITSRFIYDGKIGNSLSFNVSETLSVINHTTSNIIVQEWGDAWTSSTFCTWLKTSDSNDGIILDSAEFGSNNYYVMIGVTLANGYPFIRSRNFDDFSSARSNISVNDDQWHHFCITSDGSSAWNFYVDGQITGKVQSGVGPQGRTYGQITSRNAHTMGFHLSSGGSEEDQYVGFIDEMGLWRRVLTAGEISTLYNNGDGLAYPFSTDLQVNWDIDEELNDTLQSTTFLMEYQLSFTNNTADCNFYTNDTGSFSSNELQSNLADGTHNFSYLINSSIVKDVLMYVGCVDGNSATADNSTIKLIHIDSTDVIIAMNDPPNSAELAYESSPLAFNISYTNYNLQYVNYSIFHPNGTLIDSNASTPSGTYYSFATLLVLPDDRVGLWNVYAYGNDTAGNFQSISFTFEILPIPPPPPSPTPTKDLIEEGFTGMAVALDRTALPLGKFLIILGIIFAMIGLLMAIFALAGKIKNPFDK